MINLPTVALWRRHVALWIAPEVAQEVASGSAFRQAIESLGVSDTDSESIADIARGRALNDVLVGAFRASGTNMHAWCRANGIPHEHARMVAVGAWSGPKANALLTRLVNAAGRETVEFLYGQRIKAEAERLSAASEAAE